MNKILETAGKKSALRLRFLLICQWSIIVLALVDLVSSFDGFMLPRVITVGMMGCLAIVCLVSLYCFITSLFCSLIKK